MKHANMSDSSVQKQRPFEPRITAFVASWEYFVEFHLLVTLSNLEVVRLQAMYDDKSLRPRCQILAVSP